MWLRVPPSIEVALMQVCFLFFSFWGELFVCLVEFWGFLFGVLFFVCVLFVLFVCLIWFYLIGGFLVVVFNENTKLFNVLHWKQKSPYLSATDLS